MFEMLICLVVWPAVFKWMEKLPVKEDHTTDKSGKNNEKGDKWQFEEERC